MIRRLWTEREVDHDVIADEWESTNGAVSIVERLLTTPLAKLDLLLGYAVAFAAQKSGIITCPLNTWAKTRELKAVMANVEPDLVEPLVETLTGLGLPARPSVLSTGVAIPPFLEGRLATNSSQADFHCL